MASANTLTGLSPVIYEALDVVSREQSGYIPAVARDANAEAAAVNQVIRSPIAPASVSVNITPGAYAPDSGGQVFTYADVVITKSKSVPISWSGEEVKSVGSQYMNMMRDQFSQAIRALNNEVEVDLATAGYVGASRAAGSAGTAPFNTANDLSDFAAVQRILDDNGAPKSDRHLVLSSAALANLRGKQAVLFKVNEAGTEELLRRGVIGQVMGLMLHDTSYAPVHTKGTGTNYQTNIAGSPVVPYAIGETTITVDTGSGTVVAGDVVSFTGDTNLYVVGTALSGGDLVLNATGLRASLTNNIAMTVGNTYTVNLGFHSNAIQLVARQPAMPPGGDAALDVMAVTDPLTGLTYQVALYRQYRQIHIEVGLAWGVKVIKPEHIALLRG